MSKAKRTQAVDAADVDVRWKDLYRIGGIASLLVAVLIVFAVLAYLIWPYTPGVKSTENILLTLHTNRLSGLIALDVLTVPIVLLNVLPLLALYAALKRVNESYALIALVFGVIAVPMLLTARPITEMVMLSDKFAAATTEAVRSQYLAAGDALLEHFSGTAWMVESFCLIISGLISALLMLRSAVFGKGTAYVGIATSLFGFGFIIPVIGPLLFLVNTVLSIAFSVLMARGFFRLGRHIDRIESSLITASAGTP
ncbi:MAG TPA: hypothetical protein VMP08_17415 [Anaerolineae bacterium]|nr:hypothetical protein [Anaerolineae bacterium]